MRKTLEIVSLVGLGVLAWRTAEAFTGPHRLPARIPTHFDLTGRADAWGPPWMLVALPIGSCLLYALMTLVARYPAAFNYPVRVTPVNRARLQGLALQMIAWLKAEVIWLFVCIQVATVDMARHGAGALSGWLMPTALGVVFATIIGHVVAMRRTG